MPWSNSSQSIRWYSETSQCRHTPHCHWHWCQTNWTNHFSPRYFNGTTIVTAFKCIFEETMPKLSVNFGNYIAQDSHNHQNPGPVCNFCFTAPQYHNTVTNVDQICHWIAIFYALVTHIEVLYHLRDHPIHALVGLFGTSYQVQVWKHNKMTSSL